MMYKYDAGGQVQQVSYDGQMSSIQPVHIGVPQQTVLGPCYVSSTPTA